MVANMPELDSSVKSGELTAEDIIARLGISPRKK
jgi:hypothetical protein